MATQPPPHRKTLKRFHRPGDLHEFTFSTYRRLSLLEGDDRLRKLSRKIDTAAEKTSIRLVAFVYMPNHVHLLAFPTTPEPDLGLYLARIKQPFSKDVKAEIEGTPLLATLTVLERPGKTCFRFWQEGAGYDRNLYSVAAVEAAIDYIQMNPVRKGLCERPVDWKWSSARFYAGMGPIDPDLPTIHGLPSDWIGYELADRTFHFR